MARTPAAAHTCDRLTCTRNRACAHSRAFIRYQMHTAAHSYVIKCSVGACACLRATKTAAPSLSPSLPLSLSLVSSLLYLSPSLLYPPYPPKTCLGRQRDEDGRFRCATAGGDSIPPSALTPRKRPPWWRGSAVGAAAFARRIGPPVRANAIGCCPICSAPHNDKTIISRNNTTVKIATIY